MNRILIIGCGDIAVRAASLLRTRYRLLGLVRDPARFAALRAAGITPLAGDLDHPRSLHRIIGLADIVLHFAPPPAAAQKTSLPLSQRGAERADSLTDTRTRNLIAALSRGKLPRRMIYISTSGVYGDCRGDVVAETRTPHAQSARAQLRVSAENQIRNWTNHNDITASILRVPGIYAAERLPLERLRKGTPAIIAAEDGCTNHIHADDLARCIVSALRYAKPNRIYHASDDSNMKMGEYFDAVADAFGLAHPPRITRAEAQTALSPMLLSFMNESRRLTNKRLKQELKFVMRYPTVAAALEEIRPNGLAGSAQPACASPRQMQLPLPLS